MIKIGIVGHRFFPDLSTVNFVRAHCRSLLAEVRSNNKAINALSAIAMGADSIFAEEALTLQIPLQIVRPFESYAADFTTAIAQRKYQALKRSAAAETRLTYQDQSDDAYYAAMLWVVLNADVLVAVWDGKHNHKKGGTSNAVQYVMEQKRPWVHIDVEAKQVVKYGY